MRILLPLFGFLQLSLVFATAQNMQAYRDHDEELALQKARALKEMKKSIDGPSAPTPMRMMAGSYRSPAYDAPIPRPGEGGGRFEQMKREPLQLSVITPQGLVPLSSYNEPASQAAQPPGAAKPEQEKHPGIGRRGESQIKTWHLSLFDRNAKQQGAATESAEAVPAGSAAGAGTGPGTPATAEVMAVVEETPSAEEGGQPERRILGFLPMNRPGASSEPKPVEYRGLQARRRSLPVERAGTIASTPPAPDAGTVGRPAKPQKPASPGAEVASAPAGDSSFSEEDIVGAVPETQKNLLSRWFHRKEGDELVVTGEEVALTPASPERQRSFLEGWFGRTDGGSSPKPASEPANAPADAGSSGSMENVEYLATTSAQSRLQVVSSGTGESYTIDLPEGTVGRNQGFGDQWAWLQLDSGLRGLVRKEELRAARKGEIDGFLAAETPSRTSNDPVAKREEPKPVQKVAKQAGENPAPAKAAKPAQEIVAAKAAAKPEEKAPPPPTPAAKPVEEPAEVAASARIVQPTPAMPEEPPALVSGSDVPVPMGMGSETRPRVGSVSLEEVLKTIE